MDRLLHVQQASHQELVSYIESLFLEVPPYIKAILKTDAPDKEADLVQRRRAEISKILPFIGEPDASGHSPMKRKDLHPALDMTSPRKRLGRKTPVDEILSLHDKKATTKSRRLESCARVVF